MKIRLFSFALVAIGSIFLGGCVTKYPKYSDAASHFPPIPPGDGRFVIYSVDQKVGQVLFKVKIDNKPVGQITCNYALFFDRPEGNCTLAIKTGPLGPSASTVLNLVAGQTQYIQVTKEPGFFSSQFLLMPMDADQAAGQLEQCYYFDKNFLNSAK